MIFLQYLIPQNLFDMLHYDQAQALCAEHGYLIGTQIKKGWKITGIIDRIIVAPLDGVSQYRFLKEYKISGNAAKAIKFYQGNFYSVLLVVRSVISKTQYTTMDLDAYMAAEGMAASGSYA